MPHIILNEEQLGVLADSQEPVEICDTEGNVVGRILPETVRGEIAEAKRRLSSGQPRFTSEQVRSHLHALEQAAAAGEDNDDQLRSLLKRLQSETAQ